MSDGISNPNLLTGWRKKSKADEKGEISPKALRGVKNLGVLAEVDLCLFLFFTGLYNGIDTEPSHCDHQ